MQRILVCGTELSAVVPQNLNYGYKSILEAIIIFVWSAQFAFIMGGIISTIPPESDIDRFNSLRPFLDQDVVWPNYAFLKPDQINEIIFTVPDSADRQFLASFQKSYVSIFAFIFNVVLVV